MLDALEPEEQEFEFCAGDGDGEDGDVDGKRGEARKKAKGDRKRKNSDFARDFCASGAPKDEEVMRKLALLEEFCNEEEDSDSCAGVSSARNTEEAMARGVGAESADRVATRKNSALISKLEESIALSSYLPK